MQLFQIEYFAALARHLSFSEAARQIHVSQPTLSMQIAALEHELGMRLCVRHARGVKLTPAGQRLLVSARRVLIELQGMRRDLRRRDYGLDKPIAAGVQPMIAACLLAGPWKRVLEAHPNSRITVQERSASVLPDLVAQHEVDVALTTVPHRPPPGVEVRHLFTTRYCAFMDRKHPLARRRRLLLRELGGHSVVVFHDASDLEWRLQRALGAEAPAVIHFASEHALTVLEMAGAGLGIALLPAFFKPMGMRHKLIGIPLADADLKLKIVSLRRRDAPGAPVIEALLAEFQAFR